MSRICFVGNEIYPTTTGGAGFLVFNLARALLVEGHEVILLLNMSKADYARFTSTDCRLLDGGAKLRSYHVDALCAGQKLKESDFLSRYTWEAYRYDYACRRVYALEKPDIIEFVDYCGPAYYALNAKVCGLSYQHARLVVRLHGPLELIDQSTPYQPLDFDRYTAYALERGCFRLADAVLYPTPGFIEAYYDRAAEPWYGQAKYAPPPVISFPIRKAEASGANIVLFYGRLFSVKGVERFVDAALTLLEERPDSPLQFYLVGYDSNEPPKKGPHTYQEYLEAKIPKSLRSRFTFTGQLDHAQVAELLPRVIMAVAPSYFETYGYTAHEMRQAGVPLILADIPAFRAEFQAEVNALFFTGASTNLAQQMLRLADDPSLRQRLSIPAEKPSPDPLAFYRLEDWPGWIAAESAGRRSSLLVCIISSDQKSTAEGSVQEGGLTSAIPTFGYERLVEAQGESLNGEGHSQPIVRVVLLHPVETHPTSEARTWFLGQASTLTTPGGQPLTPGEVRSLEAVLVLRSGDSVDPFFIDSGLALLARQPQVGYVCCWKTIHADKGDWLQTHPLASISELAPFEVESPLQRCIYRTQPGLALADIFDARLDQLGEMDMLWRMEDELTCGIQIPAVLLSQAAEAPFKSAGSELGYLLLARSSPLRSSRLGRYLGMLTANYQLPYLPLQAVWAQRSGMETANSAAGSSFLVQPGWRRRLYLRLSRGGRFSQALLAGLTWGWQNWQKRATRR